MTAIVASAEIRATSASRSQHTAQTAMEFFKLPANRVVELGSQVEI